ncbi:hypothetical protein [Flavisolibacter nicotianae]|uniref:hypothetical protein n=1 Tax=Flavisolibacter nicotianae TaxID=2364882 RepID=UPI000EAC358A|nr:hypothetical protein [Flavisolibacter nicotianae]
MKKFLPALWAAFLILASCSNDKAKVKSIQKNEDGSSTTTTVDMQKMAEASDKSQEKIEELKKLTPLRLDQLKALLPEELAGMKRSSYNTSSTMGYAMAEGTYRKDDSTELKVVVYDCAGEAGSALYTMTYWGAMNFQQESDKEYTKTIDFKGVKAIENYKKEGNESSLTYVSNDRLLVVLNGTNLKPDEVKEAANHLSLNL